MKPLVSIIIPTRNRAETFLPQAIRSVVAQTYANWEMFVVDDASTDNTASVVALFAHNDPRIRYLRAQGKGPGMARKIASQQISGEYLAFLDDDDVWLPDKLDIQMGYFNQHPEVALLYTKAIVIDGQNKSCGEKPSGPATRTFQDLIERNAIVLSSALVRRSSFEKVGGFDGYISPSEDYYLWLRISRLYPIAYLEQSLVHYRRHQTNFSSQAAWKRLQKAVEIFERIQRLPLAVEDRVRVERRLRHLRYLYGRHLIFNHQLPEARCQFQSLLKLEGNSSLNDSLRALGLCGLTWAPRPVLDVLRRRWQRQEPQLFFSGKPGNSAMTPMAHRIVYVEAGSGTGGSAKSLYRLLTHLNRRRWQPIVIMHETAPIVSRIREMGIEVHVRRLRPKMDEDRPSSGGFGKNLVGFHLPLALELWKLFRGTRPALIHLNNSPQVGLAAIVVARMLGIPVVSHLRTTRGLSRLEKRLMPGIRRLIVLSQPMAHLCRAEGLTDAKFCVIPDGVEISESQATSRLMAREALGLDAEGPVIGIVGRLIPFKGHEDFFRAGALLAKRHPGLRFVVAGGFVPETNGFEQRLHRLVDSLGLTSSVRWLGWRTHTEEVYAALDVLTMPSQVAEGLPSTILEAMASGIPVVASDIGGIPDVVAHGSTGFLVPPKDPHRLAEAVGMLLSQPTLRQSFAHAALERVRQFDIQITVKRLESLYEECVQG